MNNENQLKSRLLKQIMKQDCNIHVHCNQPQILFYLGMLDWVSQQKNKNKKNLTIIIIIIIINKTKHNLIYSKVIVAKLNNN